ncbi:anti-sigma-I factor RsgI family protein [Clostridium saccharoperbutylacetonicum]
MEDKMFAKLDELDIEETNLLLDDEIKIQMSILTKRRIEQSIMKKAGYEPENKTQKDKIYNVLGGLIMKRKIALALSGALILSLGGGGFAYAKTTPVAYVSMDINPSVELGVNTFNEVVSAEAYNEDGEKVLEGTNLIKTDVDKAVSTIITNAINDGYVKEDGTSGIEITTASDKEKVADKLEETVKEVVNKTLEDNEVDATVEAERVALQRRDEARKLGITPGKLNLIQKLQELDPAIKVEDYKSSSVKEIMKKTNELRKANKQNEENLEGTATDSDNASKDSETTTQNDDKQSTSTQNTTDSDKTSNVKEEKNNGVSKTNENNGKKDDEVKNDLKQGNNANSASEKKNNSNANAQSNNNSSKSENNNKSNSSNKGNNK